VNSAELILFMIVESEVSDEEVNQSPERVVAQFSRQHCLNQWNFAGKRVVQFDTS
jgi:hypothetical protein